MTKLLSDEKRRSLWLEFNVDYETIYAIEAAVLEAQKQEPWPFSAAWWALVMGAAAALEDAANFLSDSDAKRAASCAANHYRIAANALWPNAVGKPHRWNDDGERCLDCGDKDWMADKYCSAAPVVPTDMVLVPRELTKEMRDAWDASPCCDDDDEEMRKAYRAMIAAAEGKSNAAMCIRRNEQKTSDGA